MEQLANRFGIAADVLNRYATALEEGQAREQTAREMREAAVQFNGLTEIAHEQEPMTPAEWEAVMWLAINALEAHAIVFTRQEVNFRYEYTMTDDEWQELTASAGWQRMFSDYVWEAVGSELDDAVFNAIGDLYEKGQLQQDLELLQEEVPQPQ